MKSKGNWISFELAGSSSYLSLSLLGFYCNFINFSMPISKENSNNPFTIIKFIIKFLGDTKITLI